MHGLRCPTGVPFLRLPDVDEERFAIAQAAHRRFRGDLLDREWCIHSASTLTRPARRPALETRVMRFD